MGTHPGMEASVAKRVLVGMSGGVDSSVAAALLCEAGYDVVGVTLNVWPERDAMQALVEREDACCPLGGLTKPAVRALDARLGLVTASKPESQEICFVPTNNYRDYLAEAAPETRRPGPMVDVEGRVVGKHEGVAYYTIGQRRGLGLA